MATCPECGASAPEGVADCPACGAAMAGTRECANCGESVPADEEACPICGHLAQPGRCETHPDRKAEGVCVVCGRPVCEECNTADGDYYRCVEHQPVSIVQGWAEVYTTNDDSDAILVRENLQAEGIDAEILSQKDHFSFTVDLGDLARVRVLVPAFEYDAALGIIREHQAGPGEEVEFACPTCGEPYEAGDATCASCGADLS